MVNYDADGLKYEDLGKGDYVSVDVIRKVTGLDPYENADLYRLALLKLREKIWSERKFFVRCEGFALRILKDAEAVYYKTRRFDQGRSIQQKAYQRGLEIDESQLDSETREAFRKSNNHQSRLLSAAQAEYRRIRIEEKKKSGNRGRSKRK